MLPMTPPAIVAQAAKAGVPHRLIVLQPEQPYTVTTGDVIEIPLFDGNIDPSTVSRRELRPLGMVKLPLETYAIGNAKTSSHRGAAFLVVGRPTASFETLGVVLKMPQLKIASASQRYLHFMYRVVKTEPPRLGASKGGNLATPSASDSWCLAEKQQWMFRKQNFSLDDASIRAAYHEEGCDRLGRIDLIPSKGGNSATPSRASDSWCLAEKQQWAFRKQNFNVDDKSIRAAYHEQRCDRLGPIDR
ncbi:MAG: hypothetical protein JO036_19995 [Candidatus Eremiobacteraeota bacterium]|nr:hypothetical protein [Candidatus Eremiobacteraeota bacterium]